MRMAPRLVALGTAFVFTLAILPPSTARAALTAPKLITPTGGAVSSVYVDFSWERLPGASRYHVRVNRDGAFGTPVIDEETVNDRLIAPVNLAGGIAYWSVAAIDSSGVEGARSEASFTTARLASQLTWPPNGALLSHPSIAVTPQWHGVLNQPESLGADQDVGSVAPLGDSAPTYYSPGTWRWGLRDSDAGSGVPTSPPSEIRTFTFDWPDSTPPLVTPAANETFGSGDSIRLEWGLVAGAGLYAWELVNVAEPTVGQHNYSGQTANWADVTGSLPAGTYTWRIRAIMAGTITTSGFAGAWSAARTFTIAPPGAPQLQLPADAAGLAAWPLLRWSSVPGARSYSLQVAETPDADAPLVNPSSLVPAFAFRSPGSASDMSTSNSSQSTRYWRVRANGATYGDELGGWSGWRSFTVAASSSSLAEATPASLVGPDDCPDSACSDIAGTPILSWAPVPNASFYRVFLRWDGGAGVANSWFDVGSTAAPLPQYVQTAPGDRTAWSVLACPATCPTDMPDQRRHFRVAIPTPAQLGFADGATQAGASVAVAWAPLSDLVAVNAIRGAIVYEVEYKLTPGSGTSSDLYRLWTQTTFATVGEIQDGVTLAWRVRATTPMGAVDPTASAWSAWRSMTRVEPALVLTSPPNDAIVSPNPTLTWNAPGYPVIDYRVEVARLSALASYGQEHWDWAAVTGANGIRTGELAPGTYRWRVKRIPGMYFQASGEGQWSSGTFTVAGDAVLHPLAPAAAASVRADDVVLEWAPFPTDPNYSVMIGTSPNVGWDTAVYHGFTAATVHAVPVTLPAGDLYWKVCTSLECSEPAGFDTGTSVARVVHVTAAPVPSADVVAPTASPPKPTLAAAHDIVAGLLPVRLAWSGADLGSGIANYQLSQSTDGGPYASVSTTLTSSVLYRNLRGGHTYRFRVRAVDRAGNVGAWVYGASFKVATVSQGSSAVRYAGSWSTSTSTTWWGGTARSSSIKGSTASHTFTGRSIAWVGLKSLNRGKAQIYVNGVLVATVDLYNATTLKQRFVWTANYGTSATRVVKIRVLGTAGRPRVDVDGFVVVR